MGSQVRTAKGLAIAAFGFVCWMVGHVQGQAVGARDVLDSDPEPTFDEQVGEWVADVHQAHAEANGG